MKSGTCWKGRLKLIYSCQSNCLIQGFKILCRALTCCLKNEATVPNTEGCACVCVCARALCVCLNIMGFIRSSGRNQPGRGMWLVSLFYSITLLVQKLKIPRLWWKLKCCGVVGQKVDPWICEWAELGTRGAGAQGGKWKPRERDRVFFVWVSCPDVSLRGKFKPVCRNREIKK